MSFDPDNTQFKDINKKGLYTKDGKTLIQGTKSGEIADVTKVVANRAFSTMDLQADNINIPNSVEEIATFAFFNTNIKNIQIPSNVGKIGNSAFSAHSDGSAKLENIYLDRKSTRLNSSHVAISYAVFC